MQPSSYTVLPAGVLDASHATDAIILAGWVLDSPIDPFKVKAAWSKLVQAWPLLVARLRRDPKTKRWEYHIPVTPTLKNSFASLDISAPLREHYTYATPPSTPIISITRKQNPHHLFCPYGPTTAADLLNEDDDRPLLHLHITTFEDGALVGLSTPHILCDGHGVTSIIRALCDLINGKPPPPPLNYADPFESYAPKPDPAPAPVPAPPQWRVISKIGLLVFYARWMWDGLWEDKIENRDVFFPKEQVARIKAEAMEDIRKAQGADTGLYVSSSDAVLAFCIKCAHASTRSRAPLNIFYTANLRNFIAPTLASPYLHNTALMPITPPLPLSTVSTMPLGQLALHIRTMLKEWMTEETIEMWLRWRLRYVNEVKLFFDPWRGAWDIVTNWREMGLMNVDFSGASIDDGDMTGEQEGRNKNGNKKVNCLYVWGNGIQPYAIKNWFGLWTDDPANGGMWTSMFLQKRVWEDVRGFGRFIRD